MRRIALIGVLALAALAAVLVRGSGPEAAPASSHREAPRIALDPSADNTDVYAFVSPDRPDTVTIVANYIPLEEPAGGPNFNEFADDVLYELKVDNNGDGRADVVARCSLEVRAAGIGAGIACAAGVGGEREEGE